MESGVIREIDYSQLPKDSWQAKVHESKGWAFFEHVPPRHRDEIRAEHAAQQATEQAKVIHLPLSVVGSEVQVA